LLPRKLKTYHIVIQSSDCNSANGSLTTQLNGATVVNGVANKLTHMHEIFIDVGEMMVMEVVVIFKIKEKETNMN
jgi:hypothetical protein